MSGTRTSVSTAAVSRGESRGTSAIKAAFCWRRDRTRRAGAFRPVLELQHRLRGSDQPEPAFPSRPTKGAGGRDRGDTGRDARHWERESEGAVGEAPARRQRRGHVRAVSERLSAHPIARSMRLASGQGRQSAGAECHVARPMAADEHLRGRVPRHAAHPPVSRWTGSDQIRQSKLKAIQRQSDREHVSRTVTQVSFPSSAAATPLRKLD
jgi:hypothetical protein